jgi:hypothetical protein
LKDGAPFGGQKLSRGALYLMLQNRIYRGEITHKGNAYPGEHPAIVDKALWDQVQAILAENRVNRATGSDAKYPSLLAGHGCNTIGVVAEKSLPPLGRRASPSQHVFRNRRLGDIKAQLEQLAMNPRRAPKRILLAHTAHEISGLSINPGPAAWVVRFPAPPGAKTHPVPANECLRTHDHRGVADIGETPIQPDEQRPITAGKPQPFPSLLVQNVQLMAKDEDFGFQSFMRMKAVPHISEQESEEGHHQFRSWPDSLFCCESSG